MIITNSQWAIVPDFLTQVSAQQQKCAQGILQAGPGLSLPRPTADLAYQIAGGVAVIHASGITMKHPSLLLALLGGTSTRALEGAVGRAAADSAVKAVVMVIDSPGGTVDGTETLAQAIRAADSVKPVYALASGTMASAAYWYGSAARAVYATESTTVVGSIGVVATHTDESKRYEQAGVKVSEIVAGRYKRIASQHGPLTADGNATLQAQVDYTYGLFLAAVAQHRGVTVQRVLSDMADGRTFIGEQAQQAGMIDGIKGFDQLLSEVSGGALNVPRRAYSSQPTARKVMTRAEIDVEAKQMAASGQAESYLEAVKALLALHAA